MLINIICSNCSNILGDMKIYMKYTGRLYFNDTPGLFQSQYKCSGCNNSVIIEMIPNKK